MKIVAIIPCRLNSKRLRHKLIRKILKKPLFYYTYKQSLKSTLIDEHYVAADDELIIKECKELKIDYFKTSKRHKTGSDRIAECIKKIKADVYVNIQGDEPLIDARTIDKVILGLIKSKNCFASTAYTKITKKREIENKNIVKIIMNNFDEAVYLSRNKIPYKNNEFQKHIGLYAYKKKALDVFREKKQGKLEISESIELLRLLENNFKIKCIKTLKHYRSVDTIDDYRYVKKLILKNEKLNY